MLLFSVRKCMISKSSRPVFFIFISVEFFFSVFHQITTDSVSTASVSNIMVCCIVRGTFHCREITVRVRHTGVFQLWRLHLFLRHKMLRPEIVGTDEVDKRVLKENAVYRIMRVVKPKVKQHVLALSVSLVFLRGSVTTTIEVSR